jgi:hypothetical protein
MLPYQVAKRNRNPGDELRSLRTQLRAYSKKTTGNVIQAQEVLNEGMRAWTMDRNATGKCFEAPRMHHRADLTRSLRKRSAYASGLRANRSDTAAVDAAMQATNAYVLITERRRKRVLRAIRLKQIGRALAELQRSWTFGVDREIAKQMLLSSISATKRVGSPVSLTGQTPAPAAWDFTIAK